MKKLNLGCGTDIRPGWINLDNHKINGADCIHDLNNLPLPFAENTFDEIYCSHVLEDFINPLPIIQEMIRITKPGGRIEIIVPNETSVAETNILHCKLFSLSQLENIVRLHMYGIESPIKIVVSEYYLPAVEPLFGRIYRFIAVRYWNAVPRKLLMYTFLKYLFPFINVRVVYEKVK